MTVIHHAVKLFRMLPEDMREYTFIAGGSLRAYYDKTTIKDIDCFFRSREDYEAACIEISTSPQFTLTRGSDRFLEYRRENGVLINLVGFVFGEPCAHIERFDFRCCQMVAYYGEDDGRARVETTEDALDDARARLLYIQNNNGTERTLKRIERYLSNYGYTLHPDQAVEQDDIFPDSFDDLHLPRPVAIAEIRRELGQMDIARRRVAALPIHRFAYPGEA